MGEDGAEAEGGAGAEGRARAQWAMLGTLLRLNPNPYPYQP